MKHRCSGHAARVTGVVFSHDDSTVISCSLDETIRFWNTATGECEDTWRIPGVYAGMDITGATGISNAQRRTLKSLGALDRDG